MAGLKEIAAEAGIDGGLARRFVDRVIERIAAGDRVNLRGLGTFDLKFRAARTFKTALMSEPVEKPARYEVAFKASELLAEQLPEPDPDKNGP